MNGTLEESADASSDATNPTENGQPEEEQMEVDPSEEELAVAMTLAETAAKAKSSFQAANERKSGLDPLAESSGDSYQNMRLNNGDKANAVHSTTTLGETENSNDSRSSVSNLTADNRRQNANNCINSNDSINSDSIDSSHIKNKNESISEDESDVEEVVHEIRSDSENEPEKPVTVNDEDSDEEMDSEEDSSDDEASDQSDVAPEDVSSCQEEGPVSIHSDSEPEAVGDDSSKESHNKNDANKSNEVLLVDDASNQESTKSSQKNVKQPHSPIIHEIASDNDDCILTEDKSSNDEDSKKDDPSNIRRSSRIMDKKSYRSQNFGYGDNEEESDIEEVITDPLNHGAKNKNAIVIHNTKKLVDLATIKQNGKSNSNTPNQKKEPTVVIIDTNTIMSASKSQVPIPTKVPFTNMPSQTLYESMAARGTTVTPLSTTKPVSSTTPSAPSTTPAILPSLTDDMFVVEAPSFIVPYVYEKPSIKPFREFVDILGKELDEQIKKEEQDRLDKEKEYREKREAERREIEKRRMEAEALAKKAELSKEKESQMEVDKEQRKNKKGRNKKDDDDASWDGESTSDSDVSGLSDDDRPKTIIIKEKDEDSMDALKDPMITDLTVDNKDAPKSNSYFDNSLGKFFINIGMNLVQEFVQSDLLKQQKRKLQRENRSGSGNVKATESAINSLMKNLEFSKENNAPYKFQQKKCEFCSFKTESALMLAHHMETPHMKNCVYKCNFCPFEIRSPHDILFHMEAEHNMRGRLERAPSYHQCPNCPFEDNGKGKLGRHLVSCAKKFKPEHNLMPAIDWEPPAKIPKATHIRNTAIVNPYQNVFPKLQANAMGPIIPQMNRGRGRPQMMPSMKPVQGAPLIRGGVIFRPTNPQQTQANTQIPKVLQHQPSISITPLPRTSGSSTSASAMASSQHALGNVPGQKNSTFVICEICDGYIKDLEQLRNHMQWIHKVKIHPKMIYNRPPLNCQKCQFRFFTDQGLERHLLGSHGLVTSSMQEASNKGKDSGRCPICGRVYQWKLLNHVARDHNMTLKPAHLSYKCTVCTATFGMYRQFENHVYSAHSVVAKRAADKNKGTPGPGSGSSGSKGGSLLKPLN